MKHKDLPERWKGKIISYLQSMEIRDRQTLNAYDFFPNRKIILKFEDESYAEFRYALLIQAPEWDEVGIFTEHCGYHIFSMGGTYVQINEQE